MVQKRGDFRVVFPDFYKAYFVYKGESWPLIDLSASGGRAIFKGSKVAPPTVGTVIDAEVALASVGKIKVSGKILRIEETEGRVIINFVGSKGISPQDMMAIHRELIQQSGSRTAS